MKKLNIVTVIGETNAGKSTLVNALVGQKVSIVSRKVQTTIFNVMGIVTEGNTQVVLIDTPGFYRSKSVNNYEKLAWSAFRKTELVLFIIDSSKKDLEKSKRLIQKIDENKRVVLVINKIDLVRKLALLKLISEFSQLRNFEQVFLVSSIDKLSGIVDLKKYLIDNAEQGEWLFAEDDTTDQSIEVYTAEITREHIYDLLHKEIPYSCNVKTVSIEHREDGRGWKITQDIIINKDSHKSIVLGKCGSKIKAIGESTRKELQNLLECPIQLFLTVKTEKRF